MTKREELWNNIYGFALMIWDGLGFFGCDHMKLGRLEGEKVNFMTPFKSPRTLIISFLGLALMIYIIIIESRKLGEQK